MLEARVIEHLVKQTMRRDESAVELLAPELRTQALPTRAVLTLCLSREGYERWYSGRLGRSFAALSVPALPTRHGADRATIWECGPHISEVLDNKVIQYTINPISDNS